MVGNWFSHNGVLKEIAEARVSLGDINYAYGYGVYETLKLRAGRIFFITHHVARLMHSAEILGILHPFDVDAVVSWLKALVAENTIADANVKMMLIGNSASRSGEGANLYIMLLNPLFPPRALYRDGAHTVLVEGERAYPEAKSLNMLPSAIAYREARRAGAYDALMVNRAGCVTEGTRSNLFVTDGELIYTPPANETLAGVTKTTVIECITEMGLRVEERALPRTHMHRWKGLFLTSTSSKVMPVSTAGEYSYQIPPIIRTIVARYNSYLKDYLQTLLRSADY